MKQTKLFRHDKQKGFDIVMKDGKIYHVSPHMDDLEV
jgi:hypothetical protein